MAGSPNMIIWQVPRKKGRTEQEQFRTRSSRALSVPHLGSGPQALTSLRVYMPPKDDFMACLIRVLLFPESLGTQDGNRPCPNRTIAGGFLSRILTNILI